MVATSKLGLFHCLKYYNFTYFPGVENLWKGTVSAQFWMNHPKRCRNCAFTKNFCTKKIGITSVFYAVLTIGSHSASRKHLFLYPQGDRSGLRKPKKVIRVTASAHLPKPVSTDLTIKSDSGLMNPIGKDGVQAGIFIVTPTLEGWSTKAKEVTCPHEVRLTLLDTNPVFQCFGSLLLSLSMSYCQWLNLRSIFHNCGKS